MRRHKWTLVLNALLVMEIVRFVGFSRKGRSSIYVMVILFKINSRGFVVEDAIHLRAKAQRCANFYQEAP